ncbi:Tryptophan-rich Synechocystis species C-terminal domain-containing protein [Bradyrhizobium lablabi]|uniref:Tryptophan-rich Synechocystis species C-terminal domain-containing protein n=1 Tax=Bradyrhizobium lablabi TaxID=722472 RepID=A0A1M7BDF4_9BRAD|nr:NF038122 family metalloprotease [Bradyrhizobium lablabi]SHL52954.1 Tryptophan-rich Synechocystis species C-terminal domain-containing protein [Bradyrhizobium lablabi]
MRSRFVTDPHDPSDGLLDSAWDQIYVSFSTPSADGGWHRSASAPVAIPPTALTNEAIQAQSAQSGTFTLAAATSGGITINLLFDSAAMAAPASFRAGIQQAASILTAAISDKITVNIQIDYSGTGGGAAAGPDNGLYESYSSVRAALINNATPGDTVFNTLPGGSSFQGQSSVAVWNAQLKLFGLLGANDTTTDDGSATFATDISPNLLVGVALHELTHAMGRVPYGPVPGVPQAEGPQPDIFDFFRFTSAGARLIEGGATAPAAYFSVDGGNTKLADYGQISDASDFLNSGVQGYNDPFNEFYTGSTTQTLTNADKEQLDALGFHTAPQGIVVAATTSQAIQGGVAVALLSGPPTITDLASASLSSATTKIANAGGSAVAGDELYINGQQSGTVDGGLVAVSWNNVTKSLNLVGNISIAAYETLLSEITYQDAGTDSSTGSHPLRNVSWTVNDGTSNLSTTSQIAIDRAPVVTAANVVLDANLTTVATSSLFAASDPDGDAIASYALKDAGNGHFVLNGVVQANNQEIDVTAAQLSQLTYQTAGGTDLLQVRVNDGTLWSTWQSFSVTGPTATVIEAFGSTSLVQVGNNYYLDNNSSGVGPELKYIGAPVVAGQFGAWAPIGAEQTAIGYDVAWKNLNGDQYTVWNTDSSGNLVSFLASLVSGSSVTLESFEPVFHQDLNGDGLIGPPTTVIQTDGSTALTQVGNEYYLYNGGSGPSLQYGGAPVVAGQFGAWAPIGAIQTTSGYDIAWKNVNGDQYTVWNTDGSGNLVSFLASLVSGSSVTLESFEPVFHQDLNGDGLIGPPTTVIQTDGSTSLVEVGTSYYLYTGGVGPSLKIGGAPVVAGQFGAWAPIGAIQTASGYDVAYKNLSGDQYTVWNTDSNGNLVSFLAALVSGSSIALESFEPVFHQDLNGDGLIGPPTTVIQTDGSTSLVEVGNSYYLYTGGVGPSLKIGGAPVVAGQFGAWAPIGAVQTASGYDVAYKNLSGDQYTVWNTDSNGNLVSFLAALVSGSSIALESLETVFHQDLNGDGLIGPPTTVIQTDGSTSLVEVGNSYYLYTGGVGPSLKIGGAPVVAGQFGAWAPIGAVQTASGYDVAYKNLSGDQYTVWNTDSNGNLVSFLAALVSGTDTALESLETVFHQDLNGDGLIGPPTTVIQTDGSTSLVEVGNSYYLYTGGVGPSLKIGGAPVVAGQFGAWAPIGAVQTASGYDVAYKNLGGDQYTVWNTDSNGNLVSFLATLVSGTDTALESIETVFHQDLNGDGVIGIPASTSPAALELAGTSSAPVTFTSSAGILILDTPSTFAGEITGFTGDGTLAGSDQIDLRGMNYSTVQSSYDSSNGILNVSDGTTTINLKFAGEYSQANFKFANDNGDAIIVYGQPTSGQSVSQGGPAGQAAGTSPSNLLVTAGQDSFVFAPNFGHVTIANFDPATDTIQISQSIFANMTALLAAIHDDGHGNAVITDAAHDAIMIQHVTAAQLLAHQSDFHLA